MSDLEARIAKIVYVRPQKRPTKLERNIYLLNEFNKKYTCVYLNIRNNIVYVGIRGTDPTSLRDLYTDVKLALGRLKQTPRHREVENEFFRIAIKFPNSKIVICSHSLGGSHSDELMKQHKSSLLQAKTYNKYVNPFSVGDKRTKSYRTKGDLVSIFDTDATILDKRKSHLNPHTINQFV